MGSRTVAGVHVAWSATCDALVLPVLGTAAPARGGVPGVSIDLAREPRPVDADGFVPSFFHGAVQASVAPDGRMLLRDVTGVAELVVAANGSEITGWSTAADERACEVFGWTTLFMALTIALRRRGHLHLHAAALVDAAGTGSVLVVGDAGSGKTTTALLLARAGYALAGDDATFVAAGGAWAFARPLHVGQRTLDAFPELAPFVPPAIGDPAVSGRGKWRLTGHPFRAWTQPLPVARTLVFPQVDTDAPSRGEPLAIPAALERLVASSGLLTGAEPENGPWGLAALRELLRGATCVRLTLGSDALANPSPIPELVAGGRSH